MVMAALVLAACGAGDQGTEAGGEGGPASAATWPECRQSKEIIKQCNGVDLRGKDLSKERLNAIFMNGSQLGRDEGGRPTDLSNSLITIVFLNDSDLSDARMVGTTIETTEMKGADLARADLSGASLKRVKLNGANLFEASLPKAKLTPFNQFVDADLTSADLSNSSLVWSSLISADLTDAVLEGVDLRGAELGNANLTRADLTGAKVSKFTEFGGAIWEQTICPDGSVRDRECDWEYVQQRPRKGD